MFTSRQCTRSESIQRIVVCIGGTNGRCDYNDMYCLMQVHLSDALVATVGDIGPDIHDVIDRTTDRVGRVVVALLARADRNRRNIGSSANASPRQARPGARRDLLRGTLGPLSSMPCGLDPVGIHRRAAGRIVEVPLLDGTESRCAA